MDRPFHWTRRLAPVLFAAGLVALYWSALNTGFLNDDYVFLEAARSRPLADAWFRLDALGNYYRPLSRQIYFTLLNPVAGHPLVFHAIHFALFLGALALLADLLAVFVAGLAVYAGVLFFALLPLQRVNLTWISCSQDLLALVASLAAVALWRRERRGLAVAAYVAAIASKESALPLPLVIAAWDCWIARRSPRDAFRRQRPMLAAAAAWGAVSWLVHARSPGQLTPRFGPDGIPATLVHLAQSLLGIENPSGFLGSFAAHLPALIPLTLLATVGFVAASAAAAAPGADVGPGTGPGAGHGTGTAPTKHPAPVAKPAPIRFALAWLALFGLATWPVVHIWSGYFYTLAAVGAALLVSLAARHIDRLGWTALCAGLLWWHAAGSGTRAFAVESSPWGWTSHITTFYFERGAALADSLAADLAAQEPAPAAGTRFFFATLPPWAGFQGGNGALLRARFHDPSLESYFYSQFNDSTAGDRPCRFYHWNGTALRPLYPSLDNPFFQVGCDLLLLDRPAGATHAFRRSLAAGGPRADNLYWLGWANLLDGDRPAAEQAWGAFGARDDTAAYVSHYEAVHASLYERNDSLAARRHLLEAIRAGIGLPHPHAILGELLLARGGVDAKYGLLELKIATWLNPNDLLARHELVAGFAAVRMDDQARAALASLQRDDPGWRRDSVLVKFAAALDRRRGAPVSLPGFE